MSNIVGSSCAGNSGDASEGEDQEDPSSSSNTTGKVEDALIAFREKWQNELKISNKKEVKTTSDVEKILVEDYETKAKNWYIKGAEMERSGKLYEAIQCYKRAVQIVPDIEFKMGQTNLNMNINDDSSEIFEDENEILDENEATSSDEDSDSKLDKNFLLKIQRKMNKCEHFCLPDYEQRSTHISALPVEILLYIFKWAVSSELDLRTLEMCSMVSRGFYLCARDPEIWRLACLRTWGSNCGNLQSGITSWREMFINRSRLQYNGCYISKTTYIRHGENSFQDQFYRPWHLVAYYRYIRFFPEGFVLMLTTPDEPPQCVGHLKSRNVKQPTVLIGHYRLKDDKVTIVLQQQEVSRSSNMYKKSRRRNDLYEPAQQRFHLELQIQNYNKRRHVQLLWTHYSIIASKNGVESKTSFEITNNRFPPLWFSRVKSYTQETSSPLQ